MNLIARLPLVGFTFNLFADILCLHGTVAFANLTGFDTHIYTVCSIVARIIVFGLVVALAWRRIGSPIEPHRGALAAAMLLGTGIILVVGAGPAGTRVLLVAGAVTLGAGQAVLALLWLSQLPSFTYRASYLYILASHGGATACCALALQAPSTWLLPFAAAAYGLSCAAAFFLRSQPTPNAPACSLESQALYIAPLLGKGVLAVGLFALVSGFVSFFSHAGAPAEGDPTQIQYVVLGVSTVVLIVLAAPALFYKQPLKLESSYRVALPLSAIGFLVLPGLTTALPPEIAGTLATTGYMVCGIVLYCTIAEVAKTASVAAMGVYAASEVATLACLLLGVSLGTSCATWLSPARMGTALTVLGCGYLVVLAALWVVRHERSLKSPTTDDADEEPQKTGGVAELDPLERDIFRQLVEGRTVARIAQELYLSPSAVKYHAQKIYRACGVHGRAELAALMREPVALGAAPELASRSAELARAHELTDREREVLECLAQGDAIARVAEKLTVSENTAKTHVKRVYKKLGVHSKQDVIDLFRA